MTRYRTMARKRRNQETLVAVMILCAISGIVGCFGVIALADYLAWARYAY